MTCPSGADCVDGAAESTCVCRDGFTPVIRRGRLRKCQGLKNTLMLGICCYDTKTPPNMLTI